MSKKTPKQKRERQLRRERERQEREARVGPDRRKVNSHRNSSCAVPLSSLDWRNWFLDELGGEIYLHVTAKEPFDPATPKERPIWRVVPRKPAHRVSMEDGDLYWLDDSCFKEDAKRPPRQT